MLDKSIPYLNIIMRRAAKAPIPAFNLPSGYSFAAFSAGSELDWAEIETSVDEFDSTGEALEYFRDNYLVYSGETKRRTFFVENNVGKKIATATAWWNYTGGRRDLALEWIAVMPAYQGLGLGKAVVFEAVRRMVQIEGDRDIFLHTQTWSYRAIGIYQQAGFRLVKSGAFGTYSNDYIEALPYLKEKLKMPLESEKQINRGKIVFLNGVSSSGKSTLAAEFIKMRPDFFHISLDDFDSFIEKVEDRLQNRLIPVETEYFFHRTIAMLADKGIHLIVDHILHDDFTRSDCLRLLKGYPVLFVGVHCSEAELERREKHRGDRHVGQAKSQLAYVHKAEVYDLEVDTGNSTMKDCAGKINEALDNILLSRGWTLSGEKLAAISY